jgi:hypothetical protein
MPSRDWMRPGRNRNSSRSANAASRPIGTNAGVVAAEVEVFRAAAAERARQAELERVRAEGRRAQAEAEARQVREQKRMQLVLAIAVVVIVSLGAGGWVWVKKQQALSRAQTALMVDEALDEAAVLREQARLSDGDLAKWDAAHAAAISARIALESGDRDETERRIVEAFIAELEADAAAARAARARAIEDAAVVQKLDKARCTMLGEEQDRAYAALFATLGFHLLEGSPDEVAANWNRPAIGREVAASLDDWARCRSRITGTARDAGRIWLLSVAIGLDRDPRRTDIRRAIIRDDRETLLKMMASPDSLQFPVPTLHCLATADPDAANSTRLNFLRAARRLHLNDFWLTIELAQSVERKEAVRLLGAAISLQPHASGPYYLYAGLVEDGDEVVWAYTRAAELDAKSPRAHLKLSEWYAARKQSEKAAEHARLAAERAKAAEMPGEP